MLSYLKIMLLLKTCEDNRRNGRLVGERIQICHINTLYKQLNEQLCGVKAIMSFSLKYNGKNLKVAITGQNRCHYAISMLADSSKSQASALFIIANATRGMIVNQSTTAFPNMNSAVPTASS